MDQQDHPHWVIAIKDHPTRCAGCGDEVNQLWRRWGEFDLTKMYCADCSVGQDDTYGPPAAA